MALPTFDQTMLNTVYTAIITQKARLDLIATDDVRNAASDIVTYIHDDAMKPSTPNSHQPLDCDEAGFLPKVTAFVKVAHDEIDQ